MKSLTLVNINYSTEVVVFETEDGEEFEFSFEFFEDINNYIHTKPRNKKCKCDPHKHECCNICQYKDKK